MAANLQVLRAGRVLKKGIKEGTYSVGSTLFQKCFPVSEAISAFKREEFCKTAQEARALLREVVDAGLLTLLHGDLEIRGGEDLGSPGRRMPASPKLSIVSVLTSDGSDAGNCATNTQFVSLDGDGLLSWSTASHWQTFVDPAPPVPSKVPAEKITFKVCGTSLNPDTMRKKLSLEVHYPYVHIRKRKKFGDQTLLSLPLRKIQYYEQKDNIFTMRCSATLVSQGWITFVVDKKDKGPKSIADCISSEIDRHRTSHLSPGGVVVFQESPSKLDREQAKENILRSPLQDVASLSSPGGALSPKGKPSLLETRHYSSLNLLQQMQQSPSSGKDASRDGLYGTPPSYDVLRQHQRTTDDAYSNPSPSPRSPRAQPKESIYDIASPDAECNFSSLEVLVRSPVREQRMRQRQHEAQQAEGLFECNYDNVLKDVSFFSLRSSPEPFSPTKQTHADPIYDRAEDFESASQPVPASPGCLREWAQKSLRRAKEEVARKGNQIANRTEESEDEEDEEEENCEGGDGHVSVMANVDQDTNLSQSKWQPDLNTSSTAVDDSFHSHVPEPPPRPSLTSRSGLPAQSEAETSEGDLSVYMDPTPLSSRV